MTQQINLFNPALRKRRVVLTAGRVAMLCALAVIGMSGLWFYEREVVLGLRQELAGAQNLLKVQRSHVERIAQARAARRKDTSLESEIARLETALQATREQITTLKGGASSASSGFAEYLRAFSRQSVDGLWLTGFEILAGGDITIRGRTLNPRLLPDYIQRLDREEVLRGRNFAALNMQRPVPDRASPGAKAEASRTPHFLEFSLATAEPKSGSGVQASERAR